MVTTGIDFSHNNQMCSYLIFDTGIKGCWDNEQMAQDDFQYTTGIMH